MTSSPRSRSGTPKTADLGHSGKAVEGFFHGCECDVHTAADDHVLGASGDPEVAVVVDAAEVACVQPPVGVDGGGLATEVAEHLRGAADEDLAVGGVVVPALGRPDP